VYPPFTSLEDVNTKCRIHLTKLLHSRHQIGIAPPDDKQGQLTRGAAFFAAYDPWNTCWRFPSGSCRFFDMAERTGLIGAADALSLSRTILDHAAELSSGYRGRFGDYFSEPRIKTILSEVDALDHLSLSGLAVGASWADRLYEGCPVPVIPAKHLESVSYASVVLPAETEYYSQSPWMSWIEALDLICIGPWLGLTPPEITETITKLRSNSTDQHPHDVQRRVLGHKLAMPFYSNGLQGIVFGFFQKLDIKRKKSMYTTLLQFGQTLADAYARSRMERLAEVFDAELNLTQLARELINVVSPVKTIVVASGGNRIGYSLLHEHNYWAGYGEADIDRLDRRDPELGVTNECPENISIYIETLKDVTNFHHELTQLRIETCLQQCFGGHVTLRTGTALERQFIDQLYDDFSGQTEGVGASLAKRRQYYIVSRVRELWDVGRARITNVELKRILEEATGKELKTGYQVTSYAGEVTKIFEDRVAVTKTRNALTLSWNTGQER
jgi:hypothetical protein